MMPIVKHLPNNVFLTRLLIMASLFSANCGKKKLIPEQITASSNLPRTANFSYEPRLLADGNPNTAWAEGQQGDGIGESVLQHFNNQVNINSIEVINGFPVIHPQLGDLYYLNNRLQKARIEFDDGNEEINLKDNTKSPQIIEFSRAHKSKTARLIIEAVYPGSKWKDTCIAELSYQGEGSSTETNITNAKQWAINESICGLHCAEPTTLPGRYTREDCQQRVSELYKNDERKEAKSLVDCQKKHGKEECGLPLEGGTKRECVRKS